MFVVNMLIRQSQYLSHCCKHRSKNVEEFLSVTVFMSALVLKLCCWKFCADWWQVLLRFWSSYQSAVAFVRDEWSWGEHNVTAQVVQKVAAWILPSTSKSPFWPAT